MSAPPETLTAKLSDKRKEFLHGIFTTALEGGIGYWSECSDYHWATGEDGRTEDINGFHAVIHPTTDEECWGQFDGDKDTAPLTIDLAVMARGVRLYRMYLLGMIDTSGDPISAWEHIELGDNDYGRQFLAADATNGDDGDYDSEVADMVVQFGLFGSVVYG